MGAALEETLRKLRAIQRNLLILLELCEGEDRERLTVCLNIRHVILNYIK